MTRKRTAAGAGPAFPAWKAFVVQFGREAGGAGCGFAGRVEHLSSGRRAHFRSEAELVQLLAVLLADVDKAPG